MSLGAPVWDEIKLAASSGESHENDIHILCSTSDCGPDQVGARKLVNAIVLDAKRILFITVNCFKHQLHLAVKTGLSIADQFLDNIQRGWQYYASLAKLVNCWRENVSSMYSTCKDMYSLELARACCNKLPQWCLSGRLGSVSETDAALQQIADAPLERWDILPRLLRSVLKPSKTEDVVARSGPDAHLAVEEMRAHRLQMGRWRKDVVEVSGGFMLHVLVDNMHEARRPLDKLLRCLNKKFKPSEIESAGGHLARLVTGKAQELFNEFDIILSSSIPWHVLDALPIGGPLRPEFLRLSALVVLHHALAFRRRILQPVQQYRPPQLTTASTVFRLVSMMFCVKQLQTRM